MKGGTVVGNFAVGTFLQNFCASFFVCLFVCSAAAAAAAAAAVFDSLEVVFVYFEGDEKV